MMKLVSSGIFFFIVSFAGLIKNYKTKGLPSSMAFAFLKWLLDSNMWQYSLKSKNIPLICGLLGFRMADLPRYVGACLQSGKLAMLAILVSGGIVLQILACALYNNWWPMLTVLMYVLLPMPLIFFAGSDTSSLYSESASGWIDATKFLTGASAVGSIAIPVILKHAGVIGWGALAMELSSFFVFVVAILCYLVTNEDDGYSMF